MAEHGDDNALSLDELALAVKILHVTSEDVTADPIGIEDDCNEEAETLAASLEVDAMNAQHVLREPQAIEEHSAKKARVNADSGILKESLEAASKNVVVDHTLQEYERQWKRFIKFCVCVGYVPSEEAFNSQLEEDPEELPSGLADQIALFVMDSCDEIDIYTNKPKKLQESRASYSHAQKMRAAMSHKFGRDLRRGTNPWVPSPGRKGYCIGNPSLSFTVSQYMISLRRRKARLGEVVTSARAVNETTIRRLYDFNTQYLKQDFGPRSRKRKADHEDDWATREVRLMLNAAYVVAFLCLLRFDEVLRMQWHWIEFEEVDNVIRLKITLPFRKTHQIGGIAPFYLFPNPEKPWLDPVLAMAKWMDCNDGKPISGYVFRKKLPSGRFSECLEHGMSADGFLECFRNNLLDVKIDPASYGTHSFRRGGCQYLATEVRWSIRKICQWGGWSENQDSGTIFKYLLSWTDEALDREDYFNPKKQSVDSCGSCGRSCVCA